MPPKNEQLEEDDLPVDETQEDEDEGNSFELDQQTSEISLKSKSGDLNLIMTELTGQMRDEYLQGYTNRLKIVDGKPAGISNLKGLEASLLTRVLTYADGDKAGKPVPEGVIQSWPGRVISKLHSKAEKMCGLDERAVSRAKKDS